MRGFTLLELLLSVAAIGIIAGISIPLFYGFQTRHDLDLAAETIADAMRRAELHARGMDGNSNWGVAVATSSVTLFQGQSFLSRVQSADEVFFMPDTFSPSGRLEIVFEKFTGLPTAIGTTTLTAIQSGQARAIGVNARGMVSY